MYMYMYMRVYMYEVEVHIHVVFVHVYIHRRMYTCTCTDTAYGTYCTHNVETCIRRPSTYVTMHASMQGHIMTPYVTGGCAIIYHKVKGRATRS